MIDEGCHSYATPAAESIELSNVFAVAGRGAG